jgi:hypothetical protein
VKEAFSRCCDYHPSFQQIAWVDTETEEMQERKLMHSDGEAERFYRQLGGPVRVGLESTGNCTRPMSRQQS